MITTRLSDVCDVAHAMTAIGGKWKISIVWELQKSPLRLAALRRNVMGISEGVLITQLKELERDSIVRRIDHQTVPPHVEYRLTPLGKQLIPAINNLEIWGALYRTTKKRAPI